MTSPSALLREPLPVEFMNTVWADRDGVHDSLAGEGGLVRWLGPASGAVPDGVVLGRFRAVRDAMRALAAEVTGDTRPAAGPAVRDVPGAVATVNQACAAAPSWSRLAWPPHGEPCHQLVTASPVADAVLARLAEAGGALFGSGRAAPLGACLAPGCVLYFLRDHPRRQWCSASCGNRARVARHYARHHAPSSPGAAAGGPAVG